MLVVSREKSVKTMEESESGVNLQELSNDDQDEAKKKKWVKRRGTLISISCKPYQGFALRKISGSPFPGKLPSISATKHAAATRGNTKRCDTAQNYYRF